MDETAGAIVGMSERGRDHKRRCELAPESEDVSGRVSCRRADPKLTRESPKNKGLSQLSKRRRERSRCCNDATIDAFKLVRREKINLRWDEKGAASVPFLTEGVLLFRK